jgi:acyl dehydratase
MDAGARPDRIELEVGPVRAVDLALFAAASGDRNPLHLDAEVARAAGFERPVVHGMLVMAYAARLFTHHFGATSLRSLSVRFTGVSLLGERLALGAQLKGIEQGIAVYDVSVRGADGRDRVTGTARVQPG